MLAPVLHFKRESIFPRGWGSRRRGVDLGCGRVAKHRAGSPPACFLRPVALKLFRWGGDFMSNSDLTVSRIPTPSGSRASIVRSVAGKT